MISRSQKEKRAAEDQVTEHAKAARAIMDAAEAEDRSRTEDEDAKIAEHTKTIEVLKDNIRDLEDRISVEQEMIDASKDVSLENVSVVNEPAPVQGKSLGEQFVESDGYKSLTEKGLGGKWSTGEIALDTKGTLATTPGTALNPPSYRPGVVETLFQRLTVADLIPQTSVSDPVVKYVRESTATSGADTVAEAGEKPESTLAFAEETVNVRKIATLLPVTDEMLEDAPQIQGYINARLSLFIRQQEEAQLLRGGGTAPDLQGIIGASGVNTISVSGTAGTAITENLFTVMNNTRGSSLLEPDGLVVHPNQFAAMRLSKDADGQFYGGGPFTGPYGGPQGPVSESQFVNFPYWGVRTIVTTAVGDGTALLGNFSQGAQIYRRSGVSVEASNSHDTYFASNLTAIRAEERLALAIYRPSAFTTVTLT